MRDVNEPILLNRSFLSWMSLLVCIPLFIVAMISPTVWIKCANFFVIGMNFAMWVYEPSFELGFRMAKHVAKMADEKEKELLDKINKLEAKDGKK
jgi:hypothetical protein